MEDDHQIQTMDQDLESTAEIMPSVITAMSYLLERISERNDDLSYPVSQQQRISAFHGLTKPSISIRGYLERIFKFANCSHSCYIVAYVYLDRFVKKQPFLPINSFNVHRLIITSVLLSAKFMDDVSYNNGYYAKVGGISIEEMNMLELDFLFGIGFQLNVTVSTFNNYCSFLHKQMMMMMMNTHIIEPSLPIRGSFKKKLLMNPLDEDSSLSSTTHHNKKQVVAA